MSTYTVKFVSKVDAPRYIYLVPPNTYHTLLPGDSWEQTLVNISRVWVCPVRQYADGRCKIEKIDSDKIINIDY